MTSTGVKRSADSEQPASNSSSNKKSKTGSIMDYMTKKPQSRSKPSSSQTDIIQNSQANESDSNTFSRPFSSEAKLIEAEATEDMEPKNATENGTKSKYFNSGNTPSKSINDNPGESKSPPASNTLSLPESIGDIFDAPNGTLIIHACNCQGSWGAGIAAAFRKHYPGAYTIYAARCKKWGNQLFESAQLISPQKQDRKGHFVGCLYTSRYYGKKKDDPDTILRVTAPAMLDLLEKVQEWNDEHEDGEKVKEARMCMINSGLFNVKWEKTRAALESIDVSGFDVKEVKVISREE